MVCKRLIQYLLVLGLFSPLAAMAQASFEEKLSTVSNIRMTINNLGMIGNSFGGSFTVEGFASCEFPAGSGVEHLFEGGLWIGSRVNGQPLVSTGALDDPTGYSTGKGGFEFSAAPGTGLLERSSLRDSRVFDPGAVSHQDFVSDFTDSNITVPGTNIQIVGHDNPQNVEVHFEAYNWNYNFANFFVILNYKITNRGTQVMEAPYVGYWLDGVIRNVNITPPGGSSFYDKGGNGYIDTLRLAYEFDALGDTSFTRSYLGFKFLGAEDESGFRHPDVDSNFFCNYNTWQFRNSADPLYFSPGNDNQRYGKMAFGLNDNENWESIRQSLKAPSNRSTLLSVGPFADLAPGESLEVAFAVICAKTNEDGGSIRNDSPRQKENLVQNSGWAQRTYNGEDGNFNGQLDPGEDNDGDGKITRFILPSPPDIPKKRLVLNSNSIEIYWSKNSERSIDPIAKKRDFEGYRLYKSRFAFDVQNNADVLSAMQLVAEFDKDGNEIFFNTGFEKVSLPEPVFFPNDTVPYHYKYVINNVQSGWQHAVALNAFDSGDELNNLESLESSTLASLVRVFPGTPANGSLDSNDPFVYPNPYYGEAEWRGTSSFEEDRKLVFANLPARCIVKIFTVSGDLVDEFRHDDQYKGSDSRWFSTYSDTERIQFSGGEHAWDLLSRDNQIIARGLYLFSVEDLDSGETTSGKFTVIK